MMNNDTVPSPLECQPQHIAHAEAMGVQIYNNYTHEQQKEMLFAIQKTILLRMVEELEELSNRFIQAQIEFERAADSFDKVVKVFDAPIENKP